MATIPTFANNIDNNPNLTEKELDTLYQTQNDLKIILSKIENIYSINEDNKQLKGSFNELKQVREQAFVLNHEISSFINYSSELTPEEIDAKLDEIILKELDLKEKFHSIEYLIGKESTAKKVNNTLTTIKNDSTQYMQNDSDIQNGSSSKQNNSDDHSELTSYQSENPYEGITQPSGKADVIIVPETTIKNDIKDAKIIYCAPLFTQTDKFQCAPASVQSLLAFWGYYAPQDWLSSELSTTENWNATDSQSIVKFFESFNQYNEANGLQFHVEKRSSNLNWLKEQINNSNPILVHVQTGALPSWNMDVGHYLLVVGYSEDGKYIYCNDPAKGAYTPYPISSFLDAWGAKNNEAISAMPQQIFDKDKIVVRSTIQGVRDSGVYGIFEINWFENYCPHCKKRETLVVNPKGVPEVEIICGHGFSNGARDGCDADYSGWSGYDKIEDPKVNLKYSVKPSVPKKYSGHVKPIEMIQFLTEDNTAKGSALLLADGSVVILSSHDIYVLDKKIKIQNNGLSEEERISNIQNLSIALVDLVKKYK